MSSPASLSHARLAAIVDALDDAILSKTLDGTLTSWNGGAERLYGYRASEVLGESIHVIVPEDRRAELDEIMARLAAGEPVVRLQTVRVRRDQTRVHVSLTINPIVDGDRVTGAAAVARDVTEARRRAERRGLLSDVNARLGATLRPCALQDIAEQVARFFAGWCLISLHDGDAVRHAAVAHSDPEHTAHGLRLLGRLPTTLDAPAGIGRVIRVGEAEFQPTIPESLLDQRLADPSLRAEVERLGLRSMLSVPIRGGGEVLGALSVFSSSGGERLGSADRGVTEELALRVGTALHNGALHAATERDRAEKAALLDAIGHGVYGIDVGGRCTFINRLGAELLGVEPDRAIGADMHALMHHHHADGSPYPRERCPIYRAFREGERVRVEGEVLWRADGTSFPAEYWSAPLRAEDGALVGAVVSFADATERVGREARMRRLVERLRHLSQIDQAILTASSPVDVARGTVERIPHLVSGCVRASVLAPVPDSRWRALASWTRRDGLADGPADTDPPPDIEALERGEPVVVEDVAARGVDPSWVALAGSGDGACLAMPLIADDALEGALLLCFEEPRALVEDELQVALEVAAQLSVALQSARLRDALVEQNRRLEARVAERTRDLRERNAELEAFAYSVSHDLRAPLRAMEGLAQALLEDCGDGLDELGRDYAERVVASAQRMERLIQDLLEYSRVSRVELVRADVDLDAAVDDALAQLEEAVEVAGATVRVERPLGHAIAHRATLVQGLVNLLSNALKFTRPGAAAEVHVDARETDRGVELVVADEGIGIAPEHQERIFRMFERLHPDEAYSGTGVGLTIVHKIADRLGGRVRVDSALGEGSRFTLELPRAAQVRAAS